MLRLRLLLSLLFAACAVAAVLLRPLPARSDDGTAAAPAPTPPTDTTQIPAALPLVKAKPKRTPQLHLPFGERVVDYAKRLIGTRYVYGGSTPRSGFDCSGFVRYVYGHFGVS